MLRLMLDAAIRAGLSTCSRGDKGPPSQARFLRVRPVVVEFKRKHSSRIGRLWSPASRGCADDRTGFSTSFGWEINAVTRVIIASIPKSYPAAHEGPVRIWLPTTASGAPLPRHNAFVAAVMLGRADSSDKAMAAQVDPAPTTGASRRISRRENASLGHYISSEFATTASSFQARPTPGMSGMCSIPSAIL